MFVTFTEYVVDAERPDIEDVHCEPAAIHGPPVIDAPEDGVKTGAPKAMPGFWE
jgi:hypothetical protein